MGELVQAEHKPIPTLTLPLKGRGRTKYDFWFIEASFLYL